MVFGQFSRKNIIEYFKIPRQGVYDDNLKNKDLIKDFGKEPSNISELNSSL